MGNFHWRRPADWAEEFENLRQESKQIRTGIRARVLRARRWHSGCVAELDAVWRRSTEHMDALPPDLHEAAWERLERDLKPYMVGVPGEGDKPGPE